MTDVMTDSQFKAILDMVDLILDGCDSVEEAKRKLKKIMDRDQKKKEED